MGYAAAAGMAAALDKAIAAVSTKRQIQIA